MGQQVQSVAYGVFLTSQEYDALRDDDCEWRVDLPDMDCRIETGCGILDALAISVAVAHVWDERYGEIAFPECKVSDIERELKMPLVAAKRKWKLLKKWAAKQGVTLSEPELLLIEVERA